ncbi:MAG: hypothetical protein EZS28_051979, partial [Streblomastix strix]
DPDIVGLGLLLGNTSSYATDSIRATCANTNCKNLGEILRGIFQKKSGDQNKTVNNVAANNANDEPGAAADLKNVIDDAKTRHITSISIMKDYYANYGMISSTAETNSTFLNKDLTIYGNNHTIWGDGHGDSYSKEFDAIGSIIIVKDLSFKSKKFPADCVFDFISDSLRGNPKATNVTLDNITIEGNQSSHASSKSNLAFINARGWIKTLSVLNSTFAKNLRKKEDTTWTSDGGIIGINNSTDGVYIINSVFSANVLNGGYPKLTTLTTNPFGAAVYLGGGELTISGSAFIDNKTD